VSQVAHLREKLRRKAEKAALLKRALLLFVEGYPDGRWEGMLHEEGCPGVQDRKAGRDPEWPCKCDGDYATALVKRALR
jgi:hypothetical protein